MHEDQIQQHVQRQTAQLSERVIQALGPLESSPRRDVSDAALDGCLRYVSSATSIAAGPLPLVNLLDLMVFVRLCREALERYWIPVVYGDRGEPVAGAFRQSERDLDEVAAGVLDESQRRDLERLIGDWIAENPGQIRVEGVRLDDFAHHAGQAARDRADRTGGLLTTVKSITESTDRVLLLGERGIFLVHRLPFILRLHVRQAFRELLSDLRGRLLVAVPPVAAAAGAAFLAWRLTRRLGAPRLRRREPRGRRGRFGR